MGATPKANEYREMPRDPSISDMLSSSRMAWMPIAKEERSKTARRVNVKASPQMIIFLQFGQTRHD